MNIKQMFSGVPVDVLNSQLDEQKKFLNILTKSRDVLQSHVEAYECDGFVRFKGVVSITTDQVDAQAE